MIFSISKYLVRFFILLLVVFGVHLLVKNQTEQDLFEHKLVLAYIINYVIAALVMVFLFVVRNKYKDNLGFLFLIGSGLKFIVFFVLFLPSYKADGVLTKAEFFTFFIPYVSSLLLETFTLSKLLQFLDKTTSEKLKNKELK